MSDALFELRTELDRDKSYSLIRVEPGEQNNEGKFVVSIVHPRTSEGALIVLTGPQLKELSKICAYLAK